MPVGCLLVPTCVEPAFRVHCISCGVWTPEIASHDHRAADTDFASLHGAERGTTVYVNDLNITNNVRPTAGTLGPFLPRYWSVGRWGLHSSNVMQKRRPGEGNMPPTSESGGILWFALRQNSEHYCCLVGLVGGTHQGEPHEPCHVFLLRPIVRLACFTI